MFEPGSEQCRAQGLQWTLHISEMVNSRRASEKRGRGRLTPSYHAKCCVCVCMCVKWACAWYACILYVHVHFCVWRVFMCMLCECVVSIYGVCVSVHMCVSILYVCMVYGACMCMSMVCVFIYGMCVCVHMCKNRCAHTMVHIWRSEDKLGCWSLSFPLFEMGVSLLLNMLRY